MPDTKSNNQNKITFHFHPYEVKKGDFSKYAVEKQDDEGRKRRYVCGIASGTQVDGHGERMTEKCIKSFMEQANSGDILLYPDPHGIKSTDDIGILKKANILGDGDWYTEEPVELPYEEGTYTRVPAPINNPCTSCFRFQLRITSLSSNIYIREIHADVAGLAQGSITE